MNFRAKDTSGNILQQDYNGKCFQWRQEGQDITIEMGTGELDRHGEEIFQGDDIYVHYLDGESSRGTVKFGPYPESKATAFFNPHTGFYIESTGKHIAYLGLLNANSEIIK